MHVKLFFENDITELEIRMNNFIEKMDDGDIVTIDVKPSHYHDEAHGENKLNYTGIVTYKGLWVDEDVY